MRPDLADKVYPVIRKGLEYRDKVLGGPLPGNGLSEDRLRRAHGELRSLLLPRALALQDPDFGGDDAEFKGGRYALAAWLDDLFILDVPKDSVCHRWWTQNQLEMLLYNSNIRGLDFWNQAERAQRGGQPDALEVFYLCVILGFRGNLRERVDAVREWRAGVERHLKHGLPPSWPDKPVSVDPDCEVPALDGLGRLRRSLLYLGLAVTPFVFGGGILLTYFLVNK
jgi:type VI secretion system protein ImpK